MQEKKKEKSSEMIKYTQVSCKDFELYTHKRKIIRKT